MLNHDILHHTTILYYTTVATINEYRGPRAEDPRCEGHGEPGGRARRQAGGP